VRSLLGPVVTGLTAVGTALVLWFGAREVLAGAMTAGALVIFLNYLGRPFRPIQAVARASTNIAATAVGERGTHDALMKAAGLYAELAAPQAAMGPTAAAL
jgi:ABC-type multidrug transport system fused ATPase/permease subunit